jgi:hypothetical protein
MGRGWGACPTGGLALISRHGRDRRGKRAHLGRRCSPRFTDLPDAAFSDNHVPPNVIAPADRNYLRHRLSLADVTA